MKPSKKSEVMKREKLSLSLEGQNSCGTGPT